MKNRRRSSRGASGFRTVISPAFTEALESRVLMVAPGTPSNPTPVNNTVASPLPITFTWNATTDTTSYDVFFDGVLQQNTTTNSWNHPAITQGAHTWQVISKNATEQTNGPVWNVRLTRLTGVDVSHFQNTMTWTTTANQGIDFAFIRASRTDTLPDTQLANNMHSTNGAKAKGILVGVYHRILPFSNTNDNGAYVDPEVDAQNFYTWGGPYMGNGYMRPVIDVENGSNLNGSPAHGNHTLSSWVIAWVNKLKTLNGNITPIIYTGHYRSFLNSSVVTALPNLWIANWEEVTYGNPINDTGGPPTNASPGWTPSPNFKFWQYSSTGSGSTYGAGSTNIDLDVHNGSDINLLKVNFVTGAPTALPGSPSPANNATNVSTNLLDWSDAPGADVYDVYLDNMTTPAASGLTSSQWTISPSLTPGVHTWRVVAKGTMTDDDTWVTSPTWKFTASNASTAPTGTPDLLPATDSGMSNTDDRTNFNNSTPAKAMQYTITGTLPGSTLKLYANTTLIQTMTVTGTTTNITTNGTVALPFVSGGYAITATQTESGKTESAASPALTVITDVGGPATPSTINATPTGSDIFVDWNSSTAPDLWGYNIYRSDTTGGPYTKLNGAPLANSDYTDTAVVGGQTYYYRAGGIDTAGNESSPLSAEVSATAPSAVSAVPGIPDLDALYDTGTSSVDNITKRNNSAGNALQFVVGSTIAGATIKIFSDGNLIGSAIASGTSTTVTTDATTVLANGGRSITATMTESGKTESAPTAAWNLTIDTAAPTASIVPVAPDPRGSGVASIGIDFNEIVANFDRLDLTLKRDGGADLLTGSQNVTSGNSINYTLDTLSTLTSPTGNYALSFTAAGSGITDVAGNALANNASDAFAVRVITGAAGDDTIRIENGGGNVLNVFINNGSATPDYSMTVSPGDDLRIVGAGGTNDTLDVNGAAITVGNDLTDMVVNANAGSAIDFNVSQHLDALNLDGGLATLTAGGSKVLVLDTISAVNNGTLDLADNDLIAKAMGYSAVESLVQAGFGNFDWLGTGIRSSTAATYAQIDASRMLGLVDNAEIGYADFSGENVDLTDILVKFTYTGDATLDGVVDPDDFNQFLNGFSFGGDPKWINGDFDLSGAVDPDDFNGFIAGKNAYDAGGQQL